MYLLSLTYCRDSNHGTNVPRRLRASILPMKLMDKQNTAPSSTKRPTVLLHQSAAVVNAIEYFRRLVHIFRLWFLEKLGPRVHSQQRFESFKISVHFNDDHSWRLTYRHISTSARHHPHSREGSGAAADTNKGGGYEDSRMACDKRPIGHPSRYSTPTRAQARADPHAPACSH